MRTTVRLLLIIAAIVVVGYVVLRVLPVHPMAQFQQDSDDQPPIIVTSGGSVYFEGQDNNGRPTWVRDSNEIRYDHGKRAPIRFNIGIENASNSECPTGVWDANKAEVTMTNGTDHGSVVLHMGGGHIRVNPGSEPYTIPSPFYTIIFHEGSTPTWKLESAELHVKTFIDHFKTITCTFPYNYPENAVPKITIFPIGQ